MIKYVAFFRNVNLGQLKNPSRAQLEFALTGAGAGSAQSFLSNGTVVLTAPTEQRALEIVARARQTLASAVGLKEPAYVCSLQHLADLVAMDPLAGIDREEVYQFCASFVPPEAIAKLDLPLQSPRGDVEVIHVTDRAVLSAIRQIDGRSGDATGFLEQTLSVPATTRNWNTIVRLVRKHAAAAGEQ